MYLLMTMIESNCFTMQKKIANNVEEKQMQPFPPLVFVYFSVHTYIVQANKDWRWDWPGNEAT